MQFAGTLALTFYAMATRLTPRPFFSLASNNWDYGPYEPALLPPTSIAPA